MISKIDKNADRLKRHERVRNKVSGTPSRPRLSVYRSLNHIYAQIIDDVAGNTLVACSTVEKAIAESVKDLSKKEAAKVVGQEVAKRAIEKGITEVVFDRGGFLFHGRIKALADAAREAGLKF